MYAQYDDDALLSLLRQDDEAAFAELYDRWFEKAYAAAFRRCQDPDQAKDITQDIFLKLWNNRQKLHIDNFSAYIFTSVRNGVFSLFEKEKRYIPLETLLLHLRAAPQGADAHLLRQELLTAWEALVESLPPAQRTIFRMRYEEDLNTEEIARRLDLTRKTVQNQLRNAVLQLRASLLQLLLVWLFSNH